MTLLRNPSPLPHPGSVVYDTPSGLGGTWTVQIVATDGDRCTVQTIYGKLDELGRWHRWDDCLQFTCARSALANERRLRDDWPKAPRAGIAA